MSSKIIVDFPTELPSPSNLIDEVASAIHNNQPNLLPLNHLFDTLVAYQKIRRVILIIQDNAKCIENHKQLIEDNTKELEKIKL